MSDDRGKTWSAIGGPHYRLPEHDRFNIIGCNCTTVIVQDDTGGLWISNPEDAMPPPTIHSTFATAGFECDTSKIQVTIDTAFLPGRFRLYFTGDADSVFHILGPDTIQGSSI